MSESRCPFTDCSFVYSSDQPNQLRTHKTKYHVNSVRVVYSQPHEEVVLDRVDGIFKCQRCTLATPYPTVIQRHTKTCQNALPTHSKQRTPSPEPFLEPELLPVPPGDYPSSPSHRSSASPPNSPEELPYIDESQYRPFPNDQTVVHHPPFNLPALGIAINLHFRCIICLQCERAVRLERLVEHLRKDLLDVEIPLNLSTDLQSAYNLVSYSSVVYTPVAISPVFGIPLLPSPFFFCDCGKGFTTYITLRTHQTGVEQACPLRKNKPGHHKGYGQRLTANRPIFEVDVSAWRLASDDHPQYSLAYRQSLPPLRDYSKIEIKGAEDEMNTSSFFYTQRWLGHLEGYSAEDILEVCQPSTTEAPYGELLRQVGEQFLMDSNATIKKHNSFGLLKLMGQTTERETLHRFDAVSEKTVKKYALTLHRLVFGVLRQLDSTYSHKYRYPSLHSSQIAHFTTLRQGLDNELPIEDLVKSYQAVCFSLFAHHQHQYETSKLLDQFFSPVICFLVVSSVKEKGGFKIASMITQTIAHIMYAIRSVMLYEITKKAMNDNVGFSDAYSSFKQYLTNGHETPMAYYYNVLTLLSVIRSDETNEARFSCTDERGREFSYEGNIIRVDDIKRMVEGLQQRYTSQVKSTCFFGEDVPKSLLLSIKIEDLVDNLQNTQAGYSFLDDPRNPFIDYRSSYGEWLLSEPERAVKYAYVHQDQIVWKIRPCLELLRHMQQLRQKLLLLCIFSAGPSSRASEVARQLLRNVPGSYRNLLILFHVLCLVDVQDKTSHKHLKDKYVPHCPTREVAALLIYNLAIFRPFEENLVQVLLGDEHGLRYHQQLWPDLRETISDTQVSDAIGKECTDYLTTSKCIGKVTYKILFWRNLVSAILKRQPDVHTAATHQQYYVDTAMMHSTTMAVARYGGDQGNLPMSDPRQVVECIKVGLSWHKLLNIGQKRPLSVDIDEQLEVLESSNSGSTSSTTANLSTAVISKISNQISDLMGARMEDMVQETVMKAMAEMSHRYFPKPLPNLENDYLDLSDIVIHPSRLVQLRQFLNKPTAQFSCPEQAALLELMIRRTDSVLAVLGTGSGKTLMILMQAKIQKHLTTVVVLPLSSLHADLQRRAAEMGVSYSRWTPKKGKFNPNVNVISVSIEHLGFDEFIQFISELEHQRKLGPLVFDEIHKIITDSNYREAFNNFHALHLVKAVVFGLTGSLSPSLYPVLCKLTAMTWKVIRTPSSRKELKYQVVKLETEAEMDPAIFKYIQSAVATYKSKERAIIFCRTKDNARSLAKLFNVLPYYAYQEHEVQELANNDETMDKWLSGENRVMVATSILGCGMDYAHIRDVVHRGPSYTMLDQYQEDSRGGRDGLECRATTFIVARKSYWIPDNTNDLGTRILIDSMYDDSSCQRVAPTLFLDGRAIRCVSLPGAVFCGNCDRAAGIPMTPAPARHLLPPPTVSVLHSTTMTTACSPIPYRLPSISPNIPAPISTVSQSQSLPRRSRDIFDTIQQDVDVHQSLESSSQTLSNSSPRKKAKYTHEPISSTAIETTAFTSPISPTITRLSTPYNCFETPLLSTTIAPRRRPAYPAGIQARQDQLAAIDRNTDFETQVTLPIMNAFDILMDKCVMCWMSGKKDWNQHVSDNCTLGTGTNYGDERYKAFRKNKITLPNGWCYFCMIHQREMQHPYVPPKDCPWKGIIAKVLYMFTILDISCPLIPEDIDVTKTPLFNSWLSKDPGDYVGKPFHNGLKLFLWLINSKYKLFDDATTLR